MARNRMIKPEFWSDEKLNRVSLGSRLLFIALWNFADDYGFIFNSTRQIIGNVFPLDENISESKIKEWLNELISEKLLIPLQYLDKPLLFVKSWGKHQTVANKSKRSYVETIDLEQVIKDTLKTNESLISEYLESHVPKRKKKEERERESNKDKDSILNSNCKRAKAIERILKAYPKVVLHNDALKAIGNAIQREIDKGSSEDNAIKVLEDSAKEYAKDFKDSNQYAIECVKWFDGGGYHAVVSNKNNDIPEELNKMTEAEAIKEHMRKWEPPKND